MSDAEETISDEGIRERSYQIWERENRPNGRHVEHWFRAKAQLRREREQRGTSEVPAGAGKMYFWDYCG